MENSPSIIDVFNGKVLRDSSAIALISGSRILSYGELNDQANKLAHYLYSCGARSEKFIGISIKRSPEMIIGLIAILKLGAAYVPIDVAYPKERIAYILHDTGVSIIIGNQKPEGFAGKFFDISKPNLENLPNCLSDNFNNFLNLAYVNYTSGSTGKPKGVIIPHKGVIRLCCNADYASLNKNTRLLHTSPITFDASTFEIWGVLLNGGICIINDDEFLDGKILRTIVEKKKINMAWLTSALFNTIVDENLLALRGIKQLLVGGDVVSPKHVQKVYNAIDDITIINGYGPTENTTFTCTYTIPRDKSFKSIPIGKVIQGSNIWVVDENMKSANEGELLVGGDGLAHGYLNQPRLNEEKFIFLNNNRVYKTGDIVRILVDGNLEFCGRLDDQIKVRGYRIELDEILHHVNACSEVKQCELVVYGEGHKKYIVAFIDGDIEKAKKHLTKKLPSYMIPSRFIKLDKFPLSDNGKVDRNKLKAMINSGIGTELEKSTTLTQQKLLQIVSDVLGVSKVNLSDNFLDMGGDSLSVVQLICELEAKLFVKISYQEFYKDPKLCHLGELIEAKLKDKCHALRKISSKSFYPVSPQQRRYIKMFSVNLTNSSENIIYVDHLGGICDKESLSRAWQSLLDRHLILRTKFEIINDDWVQIIDNNCQIEIEFLDESHAYSKDEITGIINDKESQAFNLTCAPSIRVTVLKNQNMEYIAVVTMHHLLVDGWAVSILQEEFQELYLSFTKNTKAVLLKLKYQYLDFSEWQNSFFDSVEYEAAKSYWLNCYANFTKDCRVAKNAFSRSMSKFYLKISDDEMSKLLLQSKEYGCTTLILILARYFRELAKILDRCDIIIGAPFAERGSTDTNSMVGFFPNMLMLRAIVDTDSERELVQSVSKSYFEAIDHRIYSIDTLLAELNISCSGSSLFPLTGFFFNKVVMKKNIMEADDNTHYKVKDKARAEMDICLLETPEVNALEIKYCDTLFHPDEIEVFSKNLIRRL